MGSFHCVYAERQTLNSLNNIMTSKGPKNYLVAYRMMTSPCDGQNCSGHGECLNGTCFCEIQFVGDECRLANTSYFVAFATIFFGVALTCFVQLVMSIIAEWNRLKSPSLAGACRITMQKLLYFVVFLATIIKGAYFTSPGAFEEGWYRSLTSAYYPLLLSGSSLIVCFWAEVFHLRDLGWERRQFISKSSLAFIAFNIISYSLLLAEVITTQVFDADKERKSFYSLVFNGCYAALLFIVMVFFLVYGVEVFFKVRGGFLSDELPPTALQQEEATRLFKSESKKERVAKAVDVSQLNQSRLGLLSQALFLFAVCFFLSSETTKHIWKDKLPISSRNVLDLLFRLAEIGVALWFPCVLWNCMSPEQLWILNPKKLLKSREYELSCREGSATPAPSGVREQKYDTSTAPLHDESECGECWICYDNASMSDTISPCACATTVHHDCLKKWLIESKGTICPVCTVPYALTTDNKCNVGCLFSAQTFTQTVPLVCLTAMTIIGGLVFVQKSASSVGKVLVLGVSFLIIYVCVKLMCEKQMAVYSKARLSSMKIHQRTLATISNRVTDRRDI
ncbi:RINGv [Nesidiocoris tenuis]|uniref:RINGv n=1 Tax=Nesidiocoris tenuis TaxID=355587 RepID=A0ABN7B7K3_9HEMI|nr:RINGv [Nesidiocoris tenuis]